ncbi:GNAT family N-acetyltransferase [Allorhodopirellula heiligendammensis]|uniref:Acetyltransferase n=1 Tax=Allorhodopirellula heiligendammensis TaxID=2714739 RepID=A0A5C6BYU4_9BACT|nr:GNAT family N-acetyltransferase [Allorhodopirellula heiligendammensis]TWU16641.1 putative acetyltransferase [Allorhodopirellula heiligendammensis]
MNIHTLVADYRRRDHRGAILRLLCEYAADPAINGPGLSFDVRKRVVDELAARDHAVSILAFAEHVDGGSTAVGLINGFETFSTFSAMPVLNLHDVMVMRGYRGQGIGKRLLDAATDLARQRGCCKVTLEVYRGNQTAAGLYRNSGFNDPAGSRDLGETIFLNKIL